MKPVHDNIDELLAADLHGELSESERDELHTHLMECAECRLLHKEEQTMNKVLQSTLEFAKPTFGFEQRILGAFRNRVPDRAPLMTQFIVNVMRSRITHIAAAAALLLALVQVGRQLTGETGGVFPAVASIARLATPKSESAQVASLNAAGELPRQKSFDDKDSGDDRVDGLRSSSLAKTGNAHRGLAAAPVAAAPPPEFHEENAASGVPQAKMALADEPNPNPTAPPSSSTTDNRKLVRNANVEMEVRSFDEAVQGVTALAADERGYIASGSSEKQENGKLRGQIVVKVLPENLDNFLAKLRNLGELKSLTLGTQDVTKQYVDTDARLRNARVVEQRLVEMLEKNAGRVSDLLQVEKELGRVREQIEQLQGDLKFMDMQVQYATVTIRIAEKDMNVPAAFLIKERVQLALFAPEVEKVFADVKQLASAKVQITNAVMDRDNAGRVSAHISMLLAPEESEAVIGKVRAMGRVDNFQVQTERVARGGQGMAEDAKTERDKVELNITISRQEDEQARQQTTLSVRVGDVNAQTKQLRDLAEKAGGKIRSSSFSRDPNGVEYANVSLRVSMKNYNVLMQSLGALGKLENVTVHREDRPNEQIDEQNAPADVTVQVYSQGNIVSEESALLAVLRRTVNQGAAALMWSVRMIGVALAFLAPWMIALAAAIGIIRGIRRSRRNRQL